MAKTHWYRGQLITPYVAGPNRGNVGGFRWEVLIDGKGFFYADTLAGIKAIIREATA